MGAVFTFPCKPEDRLRAALRSLDAALQEQQAAVAEFRSSLGELGGAVAALEGSVMEFGECLHTTAAEVASTHQAALRLERTAERWLKS